MGLSNLLGFIALAGWIMLLAGAAIAIGNMARNQPARGGVGLALFGLIVGVIFFFASSGLVEVGPTQVAVIYQRIGGDSSQNSLWPTPLRSGVHIIAPIINEPIYYSIETRNYTMSARSREGAVQGDDAIEARTSDGQIVKVDAAALYGIDPALANLVHVKWQNRFDNEFVRPQVRSVVRQVIANYSVNDIYTNTGLIPTASATVAESKLPEIQAKIEDTLAPLFKDNGLVLQSMLLREITFSEEYINAIEARQVAEQQAQQAKQEAERKRTIAQGDADAAVTTAKGKAEATIIQAEAEAKALELVSQQLKANPLLVQWRYIERLAGNITLALIPSNSPYLFDINSLISAAGGSAEPQATTTPSR
jgi:regulator of protease activity HflC (stomatin/prohibitin superfamily)